MYKLKSNISQHIWLFKLFAAIIIYAFIIIIEEKESNIDFPISDQNRLAFLQIPSKTEGFFKFTEKYQTATLHIKGQQNFVFKAA